MSLVSVVAAPACDEAPSHPLPLPATACLNAGSAGQRPLGEVVGAIAPARIKNVPAQFYGHKQLLAVASDPANALAIIQAKEQSKNRKIGLAIRKQRMPQLQLSVGERTFEIGTSKHKTGLTALLGASICDAFGIPADLRNGDVRRRVERVDSTSSVWDADAESCMPGAAWQFVDP